MRLLNLVARPHPAGNRIDIGWTLPFDPAFSRVRVVRRTGSHPITPNPASPGDGVVVPEITGHNDVVDAKLRGGTVYYYALFPYESVDAAGNIVISDETEQLEQDNAISAMATSPAGMADEMYALLPPIYSRFDTSVPGRPPAGMDREDLERGQLRRFLDLPGGQLDQAFSYARSVLDFRNLDQVDGRLLPLIAQWIGWNTDNRSDISAQRNEIRHAPYMFRTIGLIPVIQATVQRISRHRSRVKEFVHNVAATNSPPRFNIWQRVRHGNEWSDPELISVDAAFGGRPAMASDSAGRLRIFHEQEENGSSGIWSKMLVDGEWTPSEPVLFDKAIRKEPTAAGNASGVVVFWTVYDPVDGSSTIEGQMSPDATWTQASPIELPQAADHTQRRRPAVIADTDGIWLFWLERTDGKWVLTYNRHDGPDWQLDPSEPVPALEMPRTDLLDDTFAFFHPTDQAQQVWLFWAMQESVPSVNTPVDEPATAPHAEVHLDPRQGVGLPEQTRWTIAYRVKASADPTITDDWSEVRVLPKDENIPDNDREPTVLLADDGNLEVFWSSYRGGRWSIWHNVLDRIGHTWGTAEPLADTPFSQRAPTAFVAPGADTFLIYRSNESLRYRSGVYSATETVDSRYSGTLTYAARNADLPRLRGTYDDFGTYLYDTGSSEVRTNDDWYARDTVGIYLSDDVPAVEISRLSQVLREFLPATDRAVFITDAGVQP